MKNDYTLTVQNGQIIVKVKQMRDFDLTVLSAGDSAEQLFMEAIRQNPANSSIEYETGDLLSLTDLFEQVHLTKVQACRFLHDLLHVVGTALKNQPVLLDMDAILLSAKADQIYMIRAPLAFECWMKRAEDIDEFWKDLLNGLPCDNYEILGLLWKARHEKRSMEEIYHDLEELYQSCSKKKIFGRRQQVPTFKLSKPLIKPINPPGKTIDHAPSVKETDSVIEPLLRQTDQSENSRAGKSKAERKDSRVAASGLNFQNDRMSRNPVTLQDTTAPYEEYDFAQEPQMSFVTDQNLKGNLTATGSFRNQNPYVNPVISGFDAEQENVYSWKPNPYEMSPDSSDYHSQELKLNQKQNSFQPDRYSPPSAQNTKAGSFSFNANQPDFTQDFNDFQNVPQTDGTQPLRRNQFMQVQQNVMQTSPHRPVYPNRRRQNFACQDENRKPSSKTRSEDWREWQYYENAAANYQPDQEEPGFYTPYILNEQTPNLQDVEINYSGQDLRTVRRNNQPDLSRSVLQDLRSNQPSVSCIVDGERMPYSFVQETQARYHVMESIPPKSDEFAHIDWKDRKFYLKGKLCMAGRSVECQVHIPDDSLSLQHARLSSDQGRWYIQDMKSCNGTFLNGKRVVRKMRLRDGMTIRFGNCEATFHEAKRVRR